MSDPIESIPECVRVMRERRRAEQIEELAREIYMRLLWDTIDRADLQRCADLARKAAAVFIESGAEFPIEHDPSIDEVRFGVA